MWLSAHKGIALLASLGVAATFAAVLLWSPLLPWSANHFGFALAGPAGLPLRISYHGRSYSTPGRCANAGWCGNEQPECSTAFQLQARGEWPLVRVGDLPLLGGAPYPIYAMSTLGYPTTMALYVQTGSCYVPYVLEGGP
jgi:hypothetical protein